MRRGCCQLLMILTVFKSSQTEVALWSSWRFAKNRVSCRYTCYFESITSGERFANRRFPTASGEFAKRDFPLNFLILLEFLKPPKFFRRLRRDEISRFAKVYREVLCF